MQDLAPPASQEVQVVAVAVALKKPSEQVVHPAAVQASQLDAQAVHEAIGDPVA